MASLAKYAKQDSVVDKVISTVGRSYFEKPVYDKAENEIADTGHSTLFDFPAVLKKVNTTF